MQRRIELALGNFVETMKQLPSNSTAGYLASLEQFDKHYIHVDKNAQTEQLTEVDKKYQELVPMFFLMKELSEIVRKNRKKRGAIDFDFPESKVILDENGNYLGMVSRRNLMSMQKKQIILVDHNEKSQAVDNINEAEILEIIDHHRIGSLETISPVYFRNQPLGCTSTIIYQMFGEKNIEIPRSPYTLTPVLKPWFAERSLSGWPAGIGR